MSKPIDQELLPCPFCGEQPKEYDQIGYSSVKCKPCGFSIKVKSMDGPPYAPELWNRRAAAQPAGVAVPEGYTIMPKRLTAENGAKGALLGEFTIEHEVSCGACSGEDDEDCDVCGGEGSYMIHVPVSWGLIKDIYVAAVDAVAAPHPVSGEQKADMADAYVGAMEDRNIWKRRALEAEAKIRTYDQRIVDLGVLSMRTAVEKPAAQGVAGLVEALEQISSYSGDVAHIADEALAEWRKRHDS